MDYTPADNVGECLADCTTHEGRVYWQILQAGVNAPKDIYISCPNYEYVIGATVGGFPLPLREVKAIAEAVIHSTSQPLLCDPHDEAEVLDLAQRLLVAFQEFVLQIERSN
jgi:hypothetical protein